MPMRFFLTIGLLAGGFVPAAAFGAQPPPPADSLDSPGVEQVSRQWEYTRDIQPLLAEYCFACHGPDAGQRQAELRLDRRESALAILPSGSRAIVPGKRRESALHRRLTSGDDDLRMPPADFGKRPTKEEIERLAQWIDQGAPWAEHWAYQPVRRPVVPDVSDHASPRNPIDAFVFQTLRQRELSPSPPADRQRLLRRVTLALTGLPPTVEELDAFLADEAPDAYERAVDRLLASPRYGEHLARGWLDLARYADTHGYHIDSHRDMWRWRDGVIEAYNRNLPFDQFTIEQLAGDLLPGATLRQRLASGFNRNNMVNFEGGALPEEYLVEYVADRVVTTGTVWMAQTFSCSRCHDHKYDPFTQRDFFRLFAYFNRVPEQGLDGRTGNAVPFIAAPTPRQSERIEQLQARIDDYRRRLAQRSTEVADAQREWEQRLRSGQASSAQPPADMILACPLDEEEGDQTRETVANRQLAVQGDPLWLPGKFGNALLFGGRTHVELGAAAAIDRDDAFSLSVWIYPTTLDPMTILARQDDTGRGLRIGLQDGRPIVQLIHEEPGNAITVQSRKPVQRRQWQHLVVTYDGSSRAEGVRLYLDGALGDTEIAADSLAGSLHVERPLWLGRDVAERGFRGLLDEVRIYPRALNSTEAALLAGSDPIGRIASIQESRRSDEEQQMLRRYFLEHHDAESMQWRRELTELETQLAALQRSVPTSMVMEDAEEPRPTHVLLRGDYRYPGDRVEPGTPASLPPLPADAPNNRLGLARWLVSPDHPLTARVAVNRYWQHFFGDGLVRTPENFGTRGQPPTHPQLLDWLAGEFVRSGWDRKHIHRLIVTSATYRQSSLRTEESGERDPDNRWLSRGPRIRLDAEVLRDSALFAAGLLDQRIGGPSVYPYQPKGLWKEVSFNPRDFTAQVYTPSTGADLYRRSLYTFWKRAVPPPPLATFDAPSRETCTVRRPRTNTPLQALVLMNEPGFVEAARGLAQRVLEQHPASFDTRLDAAFRLVLARRPTATERAWMHTAWRQQRAEFAAEREQANRFLRVGESTPSPRLDPVELATWSVLASILLNLDETVNH